MRETVSLWRRLSEVEKPIIIYGMGDGADKLISVMNERGISVSGFMASDEFVRGHSFKGFEVLKLADIERKFEDFILLIAFGTSRPEVLKKIYSIAEKYETYAPDLAVCGEPGLNIFDEEYISKNIERINAVRDLLCDNASKKTFDSIIDYKISSKIEHLRAGAGERSDALNLLDIKRDGSEIFFDFGAYNGDTVSEFIALTEGNWDKIYAFEPDTKNFKKLIAKHGKFPKEKFEAVNAALGDCDKEKFFNFMGGRQSSLSARYDKNLSAVRAITADRFCIEREKEIKPTLIKIDVEGFEAEALRGSARILKTLKPKLIVSLYHKSDDLLTLPMLIKNINSSYKLHLRRQECIPAWDMDLYCF